MMIDAADVMSVFQKYRGDALVIPHRSTRHWVNISTNPKRDIPLGDPSMGGHACFAFGLAEAQPDKKVVLFDSEGDILMNLGVLATIAEMNPKNFYHFLMDNECYATTGGQPVPNAKNISYSGIAREAGYPSTYFYDDLEDLANNIERILSEPGPVFVHVKIIPEIQNEPSARRRRPQVPPAHEVLRDIREELGVSTG